jgi:NAD(P)-dependent dehydrogenase (short-subunit alcohol dehydrogenase family)
MKSALVTGAPGLIGSESVKRFAAEGFKMILKEIHAACVA